MKQPKGYENGTNQICELLKSLYGLKQAGRKWNMEFDGKIKEFAYNCTHSNPCTYIKQDSQNITILTIWVDNILLFGMFKELIEQTISNMRQVWEVMVLGEPAKIVGIEITRPRTQSKLHRKYIFHSFSSVKALVGSIVLLHHSILILN